MAGMRSAVGEIVSVVSSAVGFDWTPDEAEPQPRGAVRLVVQTLVVAVLVAVVAAVRQWINGTMGAPTLAWLLGAALLALPMAVHAVAGPPNRDIGAFAGFGVAVLGCVLAWVLAGTQAWTAFGIAVLAFVAGGALFGTVSPIPAPERE